MATFFFFNSSTRYSWKSSITNLAILRISWWIEQNRKGIKWHICSSVGNVGVDFIYLFYQELFSTQPAIDSKDNVVFPMCIPQNHIPVNTVAIFFRYVWIYKSTCIWWIGLIFIKHMRLVVLNGCVYRKTNYREEQHGRLKHFGQMLLLYQMQSIWG